MLLIDIKEVKRIDALTSQLFFEDPYFENTVLRKRTTGILEYLKACAEAVNSSSNFLSPIRRTNFMTKENVEDALQIKRTLMISPHKYRLYFFNHDTPFDPDWMDAENINGRPLPAAGCGGKNISMCLFPALARHPEGKLPPDTTIAKVLIRKKKYLLPQDEIRHSEALEVMAKAIVLVH
jgi:hypothetical protein